MSEFLRTSNLLAAVAGAVQGRIEDRIKRHPNQTSSSMAALNVIGMYDGCSNSELSKAIGLSHTATVRLVDKLEAEGLVIARPGLDRRSVQLSLTSTGTDHARSLLLERCLAVGGIVELLDPEEQRQLTHVLEKMLLRLAGRPTGQGHVCRLCDETACPAERCPVHQADHLDHPVSQ